MASMVNNHFLSFSGDSDEEEQRTGTRTDAFSTLDHPRVFRTFSNDKTSSQQEPKTTDIATCSSGIDKIPGIFFANGLGAGDESVAKLSSDRNHVAVELNLHNNVSGNLSYGATGYTSTNKVNLSDNEAFCSHDHGDFPLAKSISSVTSSSGLDSGQLPPAAFKSGHEQTAGQFSTYHPDITAHTSVNYNTKSLSQFSSYLSDPLGGDCADSTVLGSRNHVIVGSGDNVESGGEKDMDQLFLAEIERCAKKQSPPSEFIPPSPFASFADWSLSAYLRTVQSIAERLGRAPTSSNKVLAARVTALHEAREVCMCLSKVAATMVQHLTRVVETQGDLVHRLMALSVQCTELQEGFRTSAGTHEAVQRNGAALISALRSFVLAIDTLCSGTIDDTLHTVQRCDSARLEYDAYLSSLGARPRTVVGQQQLDQRRTTLDLLTRDTEVKLSLAEVNRIGVVRRQLSLLRRAFDSYFSHNRASLDQAAKHPNLTVGSLLQTTHSP